MDCTFSFNLLNNCRSFIWGFVWFQLYVRPIFVMLANNYADTIPKLNKSGPRLSYLAAWAILFHVYPGSARSERLGFKKLAKIGKMFLWGTVFATPGNIVPLLASSTLICLDVFSSLCINI